MQKNCNSNLSFRNLYTSQTLKKTLKNNKKNVEFVKECNSIRNTIRKNNLHKKENVDVILSYNKEDGFYGLISSKEQGIPNHPQATCKINKEPSKIKKFTDWVDSWNEAYDPIELKKFHDLMEKIKSGELFKK